MTTYTPRRVELETTDRNPLFESPYELRCAQEDAMIELLAVALSVAACVAGWWVWEWL